VSRQKVHCRGRRLIEREDGDRRKTRRRRKEKRESAGRNGRNPKLYGIGMLLLTNGRGRSTNGRERSGPGPGPDGRIKESCRRRRRDVRKTDREQGTSAPAKNYRD